MQFDNDTTRRTLVVNGKTYQYFSLAAAQEAGLAGVDRLPYTLKILLENLLRRLAVLHAGDAISAAELFAELKEPVRTMAADEDGASQSLSGAVDQYLTQYFLAHGDKLPPAGVYDRILAEVERPLISICLAATRGNQIKAAHLLGLNRNTLRKKIKDLGLEVTTNRATAPARLAAALGARI